MTVAGFGSLLSEASARSTFPQLRNFRQGRLRGWRRVFAHQVGARGGRAAAQAVQQACRAAVPGRLRACDTHAWRCPALQGGARAGARPADQLQRCKGHGKTANIALLSCPAAVRDLLCPGHCTARDARGGQPPPCCTSLLPSVLGCHMPRRLVPCPASRPHRGPAARGQPALGERCSFFQCRARQMAPRPLRLRAWSLGLQACVPHRPVLCCLRRR